MVLFKFVLKQLLLIAFLFGSLAAAETDPHPSAKPNHTDTKIEFGKNWQTLSQHAQDTSMPIVVLLERSDCSYCEVVRNEFLNPLSISSRYKDKILFTRVSLDKGQQLIDQSGEMVSTEQFADQYGSNFTPTVLFLDSEGKQLTEKLMGMSGRDYYGYYLEQGIEKALASLIQIDAIEPQKPL